VAGLRYPSPPLADDVVRLRPWRGPEELMAFADPVVLRFSWPHARAYTEEDARAFFAEREQRRLDGHELNFALVDPRDDDAVLGGGSIHEVDLEQGRAGIGYWLAAAARGRGIATRAVRLMTDWAFAGLGLARLEITCAPDNLASQRVAERAGFAREGLLRSHMAFKGGRRDTVVYGLIRKGSL
jgi:RimJ/RimL family protein N-acetyltransferase